MVSRSRAVGLVLYATALILVVVAGGTLGLRWAVAHAERYRAPLTQILAARVGREVRIGAVSGEFAGWRPRLHLRDVRIGAGDTRLELPELIVSISLWDSLLAAEPQVARMVAHGAALTLIRGADGRLVPPGGAAVGMDALPDTVALRDGVVRLVGALGTRTVVFTDVTAELKPDAGGVRIGAEALAPGVVEGTVRLAYRGAANGSSGRGYLTARRVRLDAVSRWLPPRLRPEGLAGLADMELWWQRRQGRLRAVRGRVAATDTAFRGVSVAEISGRARWRASDGGWRLTLRDWRWRTADGSGRVPALGVARGRDSWRAAAPELSVGPLQALALSVPAVPAAVREPLAALRPGGRLRTVRAAVAGTNWRVAAELQGIGTEPRGRWPGFAGVSGELVAADRGGRFALQARRGALSMPWLFRKPLPYERLTLSGSWRHRDDGLWRVAVPEVRLDSPHGQARGRAAVWLGLPGGPFLDLAARLKNGDGRYASLYYPTGIMPDELVRWLDQAIGGGRVPHAEMLLYGPAEPFPYRGGEGHFHIRGRAEAVPFSFHPEWPRAENVSGELSFENESMHVRADGGRLFDVALSAGEAHIPELEHDPVLEVQAAGAGPAEDMLRFLREAPITDDAPALLDELRIGGSHPVAVSLRVPLKDVERTEVDGSVALEQASVALAGQPYGLDAVNGTVSFSERGLAWEELRGRFAGTPWLSRARTENGSSGARILVNTHFTAAPGELLPEQTSLTSRTSGETQWLVHVDAPGFPPRGRDGPVRVRVDSDLRGLGVELPAPWGKPPEAALTVQLTTTLDREGLASPVRIRWGEDTRLRLRLADERLGALAIGLGGVPAPSLPDARATVVAGRLEQPPEALSSGAGVEFALAGGAIPPLARVELELASLAVAGYRARSVALEARRTDEAWQVALSGPDVAGEITVPAGAEPIRARLARLHLQRVARGSGDSKPTRDMPALPALDVEIASLRLDDRPIGEVALRSNAPGAAVRLERLAVTGSTFSLTAQGLPADPGTRVRLSADSADVGGALERLGYPRAISGGQGSLHAELAWPGRLTAPQPGELSGHVSFTVRDGVLPAMEPGAGRLLGLLSVALLPRRLLFDFSDIVGEGLVFDRLEANLKLRDGVLQPETFFLEGPAGRIDIAGPVYLGTGHLEQTVTVTPNVSSTLPLIGLAAGPQTAILLFLAERLFGGGVDRLTRYRYRVSGPIEDPRIEPLEMQRRSEEDGRDDPKSPLDH